MHCQTLFTHIADEYLAIEKFRTELAQTNLCHLICYYTDGYDFRLIQKALLEQFPGISFHGASSCQAVMTNHGYHTGPVIAVFAIYDSGQHSYGTGISRYSNNIEFSVNEALDMALLHAKRPGEVPNLILLHATPGNEEQIIECIDDRFRTLVPIIGGSAADDNIEGRWSIISTQGSEQHGISLTLFYSSQPVDVAFSAGHSPTSITGIATKTKGRCLLEIDHQSALDVYRDWTNHQDTQIDKEFFLFTNASAYPLGRFAGSLFERPYYKLSHPIRETPDGGIELFSTIKEGETLTLMKGCRQQLIARAARVVNNAFNQKLEKSQKIGVVNIFCAGPMLHLKQDINAVCEQINRELDHLPFICPFTFGEQGRFIGGENGHGNLMISSAIFHKPYDR
ncbi:FIST N-terminal domain-containing protein [Vibrio alfacsensis]|uniref:FIST signal transduction protein n=1 Tax=Vibrio alfacsensis TaxID=1074311 RepID=UPI002ADD53EB|nr:FIST N-terminal domain-containing protein [Vibrio alfacsensis]WQE77513.1 FIST N-terminal domain-containing protein [Vibrio alfacsensis]